MFIGENRSVYRRAGHAAGAEVARRAVQAAKQVMTAPQVARAMAGVAVVETTAPSAAEVAPDGVRPARDHRPAPDDPGGLEPDDVAAGTPRALPAGDIAAINNSFGFGGHDVALVFRSA